VVGTGDEVREYVHVKDAARSSVRILDDEYSNDHVVITGHHPMRYRDLLTMIREIVGRDIEIEIVSADGDDAKHGNSGHFLITPYSFRPRIAKKLVNNPYLDMGQGLLDCLESLYEEEQIANQQLVTAE